jgi:hypothetical protein
MYVIGMKDQLNAFDLVSHPLSEHIAYVTDEMGFVLFDKRERASAESTRVSDIRS